MTGKIRKTKAKQSINQQQQQPGDSNRWSLRPEHASSGPVKRGELLDVGTGQSGHTRRDRWIRLPPRVHTELSDIIDHG